MASADYGSDFAAAMRAIARQRAGLADLQSRTTNRLNEDYTTGTENLGRERDRTVKNLQDYLATNGNLLSGANVAEQGNIAEDFVRNIVEMTRGRSRDLEDLISQITSSNQNLLGQEESLQFNKAQADAQAALQSAQQQAAALAASQPVYQPDGTYSVPQIGAGSPQNFKLDNPAEVAQRRLQRKNTW